MSDAAFTPEQIAWARAQLDLRAREEWEIEAGKKSRDEVQRARCIRAQQAGMRMSRTMNRELFRVVASEARS